MSFLSLKLPLAIFWKKNNFLSIFLKINVKFLAIFWQSNGNFPEGQDLTISSSIWCLVSLGGSARIWWAWWARRACIWRRPWTPCHCKLRTRRPQCGWREWAFARVPYADRSSPTQYTGPEWTRSHLGCSSRRSDLGIVGRDRGGLDFLKLTNKHVTSVYKSKSSSLIAQGFIV